MKNLYFSSPTVSAQQAHSFPLLYFFFFLPSRPSSTFPAHTAARPVSPPSLLLSLPRGTRPSAPSPSPCSDRTPGRVLPRPDVRAWARTPGCPAVSISSTRLCPWPAPSRSRRSRPARNPNRAALWSSRSPPPRCRSTASRR